MKKAVFWAIVILIGYLQYRFWFADDGFIGNFRLKSAIRAQRTENNDMLQKSGALGKDIEALKKGGHAVEGRARDELGMTKRGETFYQVTK